MGAGDTFGAMVGVALLGLGLVIFFWPPMWFIENFIEGGFQGSSNWEFCSTYIVYWLLLFVILGALAELSPDPAKEERGMQEEKYGTNYDVDKKSAGSLETSGDWRDPTGAHDGHVTYIADDVDDVSEWDDDDDVSYISYRSSSSSSDDDDWDDDDDG